MQKTLPPTVWAFDAEWVPDPETGYALYGPPEGTSKESYSDDEKKADENTLVDMMFQDEALKRGTVEKRPYLPTPLCRLVCVSLVSRSQKGVQIISFPKLPTTPDQDPETEVNTLEPFLCALEKRKPQIVGWNSSGADIWIMVQRAMRCRLSFPGLVQPDKPWLGLDYFSKNSDGHLDLMNDLAGWGRKAKLNDMAACCQIPGKIGTSGADVLDLWREGRVLDIVHYCEHDALTTYLIWLRQAYLMGCVKDLDAEEMMVEAAILASGEAHLMEYLEVWRELRAQNR